MISPVGEGPQDLPSTVEVKMTSAVRALVRRLAEKNGYNTDVVEAMIDKNKELIVDGKSGVIPIRRNGDVEVVPLTEVIKETRRVPKELYDLTKVFE